MDVLKKAAAVLTALLLTVSLAACGAKNEAAEATGNAQTAENAQSPAEAAQTEDPSAPEETPAPQESAGDAAEEAAEEDDVTIMAAALKGPTAMGLVRLMRDAETGKTAPYEFLLGASADEVTPLLLKGTMDIVCVPANLASVLYNRTEGGLVCLAVNTLGVLYIVETGEELASMADLAGKTIVAAGKGSTPEYALRYLLSQNGLDPDKDMSIEWKSEHSECVAALASGAATIALLPQPFVTVAQGKVENLRVALDLTEEWDRLENGSSLITGVAVARRAFVEEHPAAVERFLEDYRASVAWVNGNTAEAAGLIGDYDIVPAAVAEKALPHCNIVCLTGQELKAALPGYLSVLFEAAPESVGGALPGDDFYYGA